MEMREAGEAVLGEWGSEEETAVLLRRLRDGCAREPEERPQLLSLGLAERLARALASPSLPPLLRRLSLQVLGNLSAASDPGREAVAAALSDQLWPVLLSHEEAKTAAYAQMLFHNISLREGWPGTEELLAASWKAVVSLMASEEWEASGTEWGELVLRSLLAKEDLLRTAFPRLTDREAELSLDMALEVAKESGLAPSNQAFVCERFEKDASDWAEPGTLGLARRLVEVVAELSGDEASELRRHKEKWATFRATARLLVKIQRLGAEGVEGLKPRRSLGDLDAGREESVYYHLKRDLVRTLANLSEAAPSNQTAAAEEGLLPALLDATGLEAENPLQGQWAILALRHLCLGCPANQAFLAALAPRGAPFDTSGLLHSKGLEVKEQPDGQLSIVPKP